MQFETIITYKSF